MSKGPFQRYRWKDVPPETLRKILELSDYGVSAKDISRRFGLAITAVQRHLAQNGRGNRPMGRLP